MRRMKALRGIWLVFVVVAVATACGDGESRLRSDVQSDLTLEEVYALMEEAIAGDGDAILHASVVITDIEYDTMTHHTNLDSYERLQPEDMRRNATIAAAFAFLTANREEKLPRKPPTAPAGGGRGGN